MDLETDAEKPVGYVFTFVWHRHEWSNAMTVADYAERIARIELFPDELEAAVTGLSEAQLSFQPAPREWSVRQIVHHLADSHANAFIRMKLALTEDNPTIRPYDQEAFAELPDTLGAPIGLSLVFLRALHARWGYLMQSLDASAWERTFQHPEYGPFTLVRLLDTYVEHCDIHLDQIARALADYERQA